MLLSLFCTRKNQGIARINDLQLQDLNSSLLKTDGPPTYQTDSQTCVRAQQTSEINLKTGSVFRVLGNWQKAAEIHTRYYYFFFIKGELIEKSKPEQPTINKGYFKVFLTIDLLVNK